MAPPLPVVFVGASAGPWRIEQSSVLAGEPLPSASHLSVIERRPILLAGGPARFDAHGVEGARFALHGSTGHVRYVDQREKAALAPISPPLGRPEARCAALIPIRKTDAWWELPQDERRAILAERSQHIALGLQALPAVARRLYHARELGEPFDFLTWFEFAPEHAGIFDELLAALRASEEWRYVEREVELRLTR